MIKPVSRSGAMRVVSRHDPAVNWDKILERELDENKDLAEAGKLDEGKRLVLARIHFENRYLKEVMEDPSKGADLLIFDDGQEPTRFVIGVVPSDDLIRFQDDANIGSEDARRHQLRWWCFLHGVRSIEGWGGEDPPTHKVKDVEYIRPSWLRDTFIMGLRDIALEVGGHVWHFNSVTEAEIKN